MESHAVVKDWTARLRETPQPGNKDPRQYWTSSPEILHVERSSVQSIAVGTGESIYTDAILPAIAAAEHEVILVTCFWARSRTLDALGRALRRLSAKAASKGRKIRVRIGFSSSSLFQKIFHTSSMTGQIWPSTKWQQNLGLPSADLLGGLDLELKSIFILPFSVMHPKFVIIDRRKVFLHSCNVSWENWFEGCAELSGPVVDHFVRFWEAFWATEQDQHLAVAGIVSDPDDQEPTVSPQSFSGPPLLARLLLQLDATQSIFLPSPHNQNPNFALPWRDCPPPPSSPLNAFILSVLNNATDAIYMQTPNLTAPPVLSGILGALKRGVSVRILTSERLMILEQLITAGTTTSRCIRRLIRRHRRFVEAYSSRNNPDLETGSSVRPGRLRITYFAPWEERAGAKSEPVQSHLKLTIIDGEWTVLGSGNMDRASWYTSQELGLALFSSELAGWWQSTIDGLMASRSRVVYDSAG